jgi:hypothetical protein
VGGLCCAELTPSRIGKGKNEVGRGRERGAASSTYKAARKAGGRVGASVAGLRCSRCICT